ALEQQSWPCSRPLVIQRVQCPADPEVFFDIADWCTQPVGRREKQILSVSWQGADDLLICRCAHVFASLESAGISNSRRNVCIHIGSVESPKRRSSLIVLPC